MRFTELLTDVKKIRNALNEISQYRAGVKLNNHLRVQRFIGSPEVNEIEIKSDIKILQSKIETQYGLEAKALFDELIESFKIEYGLTKSKERDVTVPSELSRPFSFLGMHYEPVPLTQVKTYRQILPLVRLIYTVEQGYPFDTEEAKKFTAYFTILGDTFDGVIQILADKPEFVADISRIQRDMLMEKRKEKSESAFSNRLTRTVLTRFSLPDWTPIHRETPQNIFRMPASYANIFSYNDDSDDEPYYDGLPNISPIEGSTIHPALSNFEVRKDNYRPNYSLYFKDKPDTPIESFFAWRSTTGAIVLVSEGRKYKYHNEPNIQNKNFIKKDIISLLYTKLAQELISKFNIRKVNVIPCDDESLGSFISEPELPLPYPHLGVNLRGGVIQDNGAEYKILTNVGTFSFVHPQRMICDKQMLEISKAMCRFNAELLSRNQSNLTEDAIFALVCEFYPAQTPHLLFNLLLLSRERKLIDISLAKNIIQRCFEDAKLQLPLYLKNASFVNPSSLCSRETLDDLLFLYKMGWNINNIYFNGRNVINALINFNIGEKISQRIEMLLDAIKLNLAVEQFLPLFVIFELRKSGYNIELQKKAFNQQQWEGVINIYKFMTSIVGDICEKLIIANMVNPTKIHEVACSLMECIKRAFYNYRFSHYAANIFSLAVEGDKLDEVIQVALEQKSFELAFCLVHIGAPRTGLHGYLKEGLITQLQQITLEEPQSAVTQEMPEIRQPTFLLSQQSQKISNTSANVEQATTVAVCRNTRRRGRRGCR